MSRFKVERNPLAAVKKCGGREVESFLEHKLASGLELVAVVEVTGAQHWIFRATEQPKPRPATRPEPFTAA